MNFPFMNFPCIEDGYKCICKMFNEILCKSISKLHIHELFARSLVMMLSVLNISYKSNSIVFYGGNDYTLEIFHSVIHTQTESKDSWIVRMQCYLENSNIPMYSNAAFHKPQNNRENGRITTIFLEQEWPPRK